MNKPKNTQGDEHTIQAVIAKSGSQVSNITQVKGDYYAPPLTAMPAVAPPPPPHFTGRRHHLDALKVALTGGDATALIALQGMGGVGKTATALKLAADLGPQCSGGIFWASLPKYDGNPRRILWVWARTCAQDLPVEADPNALADLVRGLLADRQANSGPLLVILDDVRPEWLDATRVLKQAIPAGIPLLLTTCDETLAAALGADIHRLDPLPANESLVLLKAHAGPAMVEADPAEAEALLQAVGYLPLAIELAGKRLALLARKPGYRLETLRHAVEGQAAKVLTWPGHPGLAATFAVTYEALPAEAQCLFRWLGAFASGPLKVAAVAGVMSLDETEAASALDRLVTLALLNWGETEGTYTLHPLLRQYAQTPLGEAGETAEAEQKHLAYYLAFAQANAQAESSAWDRLEEELPNLLLAAKRAAKIKDSAAMVSFEEALIHESNFMNVRGYYQEAVELLTESLATQEAVDIPQKQPRTLNKLAYFHVPSGQLGLAQQYAERAYELAVILKDREQRVDSLHYLGIVFDRWGKKERALEYFEKELEIRQELRIPSRLANCLNSLGVVQVSFGNYAEAKRYFSEALAAYSAAGDRQGIARCIANRGVISLYLGNYNDAITQV